MQKKVWICDDEVSKRFPVYTRANAGEVFAVAVSPLTWTAFGRLAWEIGFREALYDMGVFTPDEFRPDMGEVVIYSSRASEKAMFTRISEVPVEHVLLYEQADE